MSMRILVADAVVAVIVYSIHLFLATILLYEIYTYRHRPHRYKHLVLVATLVILGTTEVAAYLYFSLSGGLYRLLEFYQRQFSSGNLEVAGQLAEIGISALTSGHEDLRRTDIKVQYVNGLAALSVTWVANGYLLYRCFVIWSHSSARCIVILPFLLYLAIIGNGIFGAYSVSQPNHSHNIMIFTRLHWALSLSSNTLISFLIVARLLLIRRRAGKAFGNSRERRDAYAAIIAVLVESSLLYTIVVGVAYPLYGPTAVVFEHTGATENMANPLLVQIECIAAEIIVLRFVRGRTWTSISAGQVQNSSRDAGLWLSTPVFAANPDLQTNPCTEVEHVSLSRESHPHSVSGSRSVGYAKGKVAESKAASLHVDELVVLLLPQKAHIKKGFVGHGKGGYNNIERIAVDVRGLLVDRHEIERSAWNGHSVVP